MLTVESLKQKINNNTINENGVYLNYFLNESIYLEVNYLPSTHLKSETYFEVRSLFRSTLIGFWVSGDLHGLLSDRIYTVVLCCRIQSMCDICKKLVFDTVDQLKNEVANQENVFKEIMNFVNELESKLQIITF